MDVNAAFREADKRMQQETEALDKLRENLISKVKEASDSVPSLCLKTNSWTSGSTRSGRCSMSWTCDQHPPRMAGGSREDRVPGRFQGDEEFPKQAKRLLRQLRRQTQAHDNPRIRCGGEAIGADDVSLRAPSPNLAELRERIARLDVNKDEDHFDEVRKPFDSVFYDIDKRTLSEVKGAREKVLKYMEMRDELLRAHSAVLTTTIGV